MAPPKTPLIKGYLPIRLKLPSKISDMNDETYFYVKEHQITKSSSSDKRDTLFVANAPVVPPIRTKLLLKSLFGRFGDVVRVTVADNPRGSSHQQSASSWTDKFSPPTFLPPACSEGRFAHVVFRSHKEMKQTMKALTSIMSETRSDDNDEGDHRRGLALDPIELQTLADESDRQYREELGLDESPDAKLTGVLAVVQRYRQSCALLSRPALLEECNRVMLEYEDAEERGQSAREASMNKPDEDGFITVSYTSQVGSNAEMEQTLENQVEGERRRKGQKRIRKKKSIGASELCDFYRFQTKVNRKRSVQELRERFEEDLAKMKKMKEEKQYRPF